MTDLLQASVLFEHIRDDKAALLLDLIVRDVQRRHRFVLTQRVRQRHRPIVTE